MTQAAHRRFLWGLCYRMTGVAADADEVVQETYARALANPPSDDRPIEPWLTKVALNLARDRLRQRKRETYLGPWLPSPVELEVSDDQPSPEARYERLESAGVGFLMTLEALTPNQRAVLLLRDVFGHSVAETAEELELTEPNVKTTLHRARAAMAAYDKERVPFSAELQERTRAALEAFFGAIASGDTEALTQLLRADARAFNDGAGQYFASRAILEGRQRIILFHQRVLQIRGLPLTLEQRILNGLPVLVGTFAQLHHPREPPRAVMGALLDASGQIGSLFSVVADAKLTHVQF